jgi:hypothetical protein
MVTTIGMNELSLSLALMNAALSCGSILPFYEANRQEEVHAAFNAETFSHRQEEMM